MAESTKKKSDRKKMTRKQKLTAVANITGSLAAISRGQSYSWDDSGDKKTMSFDAQDTNGAAGKPVPTPNGKHTKLEDQTISPFKEYNA
jgi:hypothetical protein